MNYLLPILIVLINTIIGAYAAFFLKKAMNKYDYDFIFNKNKKYFFLLGGIILYGVAAVVFVGALKLAPISVLFPITSATYMWSIILAKNKLNEEISNSKILGLICIILGIIVVAFS